MDWVLDSSLALAWALPDETSPQADRFLARVSRDSVLWVPALGDDGTTPPPAHGGLGHRPFVLPW